MLFNSIEYLLFLPTVFILYWLLSRKVNVQNAFLLAASYLFYGWWDVRALGLIFLTSVASFSCGIGIEHWRDQKTKANLLLAGNLLLNLGLLGLFKYYNFFRDSLQEGLADVGWTADLPTLHLLLPVGISFYTFQALSYSIDVWRGQIKATRNGINYFTYISFFPQLVAGPIERATHLLPQIEQRRAFRYEQVTDGMRQMLWGFFKKMVVADNCAVAVNAIWADYSEQSSGTLIVGALLFSLQIYSDFSGYSDIAIGSAKLLGIDLVQNFRLPYFAVHIGDFWRRWHISLMTWFKDYVYIPLGGNRKGKIRTYVNTLAVFGCSGLWHGANWTYIVWGLYHGTLVCLQKALGIGKKGEVPALWKKIGGMFFTFSLVTLGWVIFRAPTLTDAVQYLTCALQNEGTGIAYGKTALLWGIAMIGIEWIQRKQPHPLYLGNESIGRYKAVRWGIYYGIALLTLFAQGSQQNFIYFQF